MQVTTQWLTPTTDSDYWLNKAEANTKAEAYVDSANDSYPTLHVYLKSTPNSPTLDAWRDVEICDHSP